jgi:hypothetical protein
MNLLFQTRKPRRFEHTPIYYSEREDRLREITKRARQELGQQNEKAQPSAFEDDIRGRFRRRRTATGPLRLLLGSNILLIVFVVLLLMLLLLLTL